MASNITKRGPYDKSATKQYKVDEALALLEPELRDEFWQDFLPNRPGTKDILDWFHANEVTYLTFRDVYNWYRGTFPTGEQAKWLNQMAVTFQGVQIPDMQRMLMGQTLQLLFKLYQNLPDALSEDDISAADSIKAIPALTREVRSLLEDLATQQAQSSLSEAELAGMEFALQEIVSCFDGTAMDLPIREAIKAIRARMDERQRGHIKR